MTSDNPDALSTSESVPVLRAEEVDECDHPWKAYCKDCAPSTTIETISDRHRKIDKPWMEHPRCAECSPEVQWPCDAARLLVALDAERQAATARIAALEGALRQSEWRTIEVDPDDTDNHANYDGCEECRGAYPNHRPGCRIARALTPSGAVSGAEPQCNCDSNGTWHRAYCPLDRAVSGAEPNGWYRSPTGWRYSGNDAGVGAKPDWIERT